MKKYLGGLTDNGRRGMNGIVVDRDWSNDEHVIKFKLLFFWIIRCCELDFRGFFVLIRCSGIWLLKLVCTSDIVLSASTASSNPFIVDLTSDEIGGLIIGDLHLIYFLINAWIRILLSVGEEDRILDGILKTMFI